MNTEHADLVVYLLFDFWHQQTDMRASFLLEVF